MNASTLSSWQFWAVLSAVFAALTAIFAKIGVENVNSDFATFVRTIVILVMLAFILLATARFGIGAHLFIFAAVGPGHRGVVDLLFPGAQNRRRRKGGADR